MGHAENVKQLGKCRRGYSRDGAGALDRVSAGFDTAAEREPF